MTAFFPFSACRLLFFPARISRSKELVSNKPYRIHTPRFEFLHGESLCSVRHFLHEEDHAGVFFWGSFSFTFRHSPYQLRKYAPPTDYFTCLPCPSSSSLEGLQLLPIQDVSAVDLFINGITGPPHIVLNMDGGETRSSLNNTLSVGG